MTRETLAAWYQASRPPFFVATLVPLALGGAIAASDGKWNGLRWLVVLLASFFVHLATNLANDYFDYTSGADAGSSIGGSRVLQEGKIKPSEIAKALVVLYGLSLICGLWLLAVSGLWWLPGIMLFSFFSSLFYTAPPVRYGYRGLGEVFVALNMGPIMVAGSAAVLEGHLVMRALWLSLPVGLMVAMILYYQSLSDIEEDLAVNKLTVAARLGQPRAYIGFRFFIACTLVSICLLAGLGLLHPVVLISLLSVFPAGRVDRMIRETRDWKDLHDRGAAVRMIYLANGVIMVLSVMLFG